MENENEKKLNPKSRLSQYVDTTGELSNTRLVFGVWYLRHKLLLQKIGLGVLIAWCSLTMGYSFWKWGEYLIFGYWEDKQVLLEGQIVELQNYTELQKVYKPDNLDILETRIFSTSNGMYDFISTVSNRNERWLTEVEYHFSFSGGETPKEKMIVLPQTRTLLPVFGFKNENFPSNARLVIDKTTWKMISTHKIVDVKSYVDERLRFSIDNFVFVRPNAAGLQIPSIRFDLYNDSAYSYWQPIFFVELLSGSQTVGYAYLSVEQFRSIEKREIDLRYFSDSVSVSDIRLIPSINVFDPEVYMAPEKTF